MTTTIVKRGQLNISQFGAGQFNQLVSTAEDLPETIARPRLRMQWGFGHWGQRQWGRSYEYYPGEIAAGETLNLIVTIYSTGGSVLGVIRTDVAKPILRKVKFTIVSGNCVDFSMTLNKIPEFPILGRSKISISVPGAPDGWYYGKIMEVPKPGDGSEESFVYSGVGLFGDLERITDDGREIAALTDVGEAVKTIAQEIIAVETSIRVNLSKIETSTGVPFAFDFVFDKTSIKKALEDFALMSGCETGVDGDGDFFFLKKEESIVKTYVAGWNLHKIKPETNEGSVRNRIVGVRTTPKGDGGVGWVIGAIAIDLISQRLYGTIEEIVQTLGTMSDDDIQLLVEAILEQKKDPEQTATGTTYLLRNARDYVKRGRTKIILPYQSFSRLYDSLDDPTTTFSKSGTGDLAISEDSEFNIDGQVAMKLIWTSALNDYVETINELKGRIEALQFYYRPSRAGSFLRVGIGWGLWNEFTNDIPIQSAAIDRMVPFEWDLTSYGITRINRLGFQIIDGDPGSVTIDRITFRFSGFEHLTLDNKKQVYRIGPDETAINLEWGQVPPRLEDYITNLIRQLDQAKIAGEIR